MSNECGHLIVFVNFFANVLKKVQHYRIDVIVILCVNCHQKQASSLIAPTFKKPAHGMSDALRRWWNVLDKALCSYGMVSHAS